jgi:hypothetical protein
MVFVDDHDGAFWKVPRGHREWFSDVSAACDGEHADLHQAIVGVDDHPGFLGRPVNDLKAPAQRWMVAAALDCPLVAARILAGYP